ncbi:MAG: hypothetical protein ACE5JM_12090 [Armatimonadota bacterium]
MKAFVAASVAGVLLGALAAAAPGADGERAAKAALPSPMGIEVRFSALLSHVGGQYLTDRRAILDTGRAAVPFLTRAAASSDWKEKTFAELLLWQIRSPGEVEELRDAYVREALAAMRRPRPRSRPGWAQQGFPTLRDHPQAVPFFAELLLKDRPGAGGGSPMVPLPSGDGEGPRSWGWEAKRGAIVILVETKDPRVPAILTQLVAELVSESKDGPLDHRVAAVFGHACSELAKVGDAAAAQALRALPEPRFDRNARDYIKWTIEGIEARLAREHQ